MATLVNLGGTLVPPDRAVVSVFDRGFLYGDSVYEVVRTYGGRPFAMGRHLERMRSSAERIGMDLPWSDAAIEREVERTLAAAANEESYIRIVATRGSGPIGLDPSLAVDPLLVVIVQPIQLPPREAYEQGVKVQLVGVRRNLREAIDPRAKTGNYLNNVLALREAKAHGAYEAVMLDAEGRITEGSTSNLFLVYAGRLVTPPVAVGILEGITRAEVIEVARAEGIPVEERTLLPEDLLRADEAMITSTVREIVPVVRVGMEEEEHPVGDGRVGPTVRRITAAFRAHARRSVGLEPA